MLELWTLIAGNLWAVAVAVAGIVAAWFGFKAKRATVRAAEATKRAEAAEDKANQAEYRETHTRDAVRAMEKELQKPLPNPKKDRSDLEEPY